MVLKLTVAGASDITMSIPFVMESPRPSTPAAGTGWSGLLSCVCWSGRCLRRMGARVYDNIASPDRIAWYLSNCACYSKVETTFMRVL